MNIGIFNALNESTLIAAGENTWDLVIGDYLIFSHGDKKELLGKVIFFDREKIRDETILDGNILRKANTSDLTKAATLDERAAAAVVTCQEKVHALGLAMQPAKAIWAFDESEVTIFFSAPDRVDFRELVPALAGALRTRIHLQQIGPRDRAREIGGFGICGRQQCCTSGVVTEFKTISLEMARVQEMQLKELDKLAGNCGKLMCCLGYEVEEYKKLRKTMPKFKSSVRTKEGKRGLVIGLDVLNQMVKIVYDEGGIEQVPVGELVKAPAQK